MLNTTTLGFSDIPTALNSSLTCAVGLVLTCQWFKFLTIQLEIPISIFNPKTLGSSHFRTPQILILRSCFNIPSYYVYILTLANLPILLLVSASKESQETAMISKQYAYSDIHFSVTFEPLLTIETLSKFSSSLQNLTSSPRYSPLLTRKGSPKYK